MTDNAYEPTRSMATGILREYGVEPRFFDPHDSTAYYDLLRSNTGAVLLESPGSLTMEIQDIPALAATAREAGFVSLIDNTWAGPLGFAALEHGCDISIMC